MDSELITLNEVQNNLSTVHLYFNKEMHSWIAYGYSAYSLRLLVRARNISSIRGFSTTKQMPYVVVNKDVLERLCDSFSVSKGENEEHYVVRTKEEFDPNDYKRWENKLKEELEANGGFDTQTHVSHLVPKDKYIKDGMTSIERNVKRIVDMFAAMIALIIFSPLFLICFILVRREV